MLYVIFIPGTYFTTKGCSFDHLHPVPDSEEPQSWSFSMSLFLSSFLKYNWPVTLCVPPVHKRVIYCYALQNDHQDKSSYHPVSYKAINLLHITLTHIINFILLIYSFCNWKFVFINLPYYLYSLSTHFHSGNHLLVHCIYGFVSVFVGFFICFLDFRYKWNQGVFVFLCMTYFT